MANQAAILLVAALATACSKPAPAREPISGYSAYTESDTSDAAIEAATSRAASENKRVLIVFGGNWCAWCKVLDDVFAKDIKVAPVIAKSFLVLHIDSDHNQALDARFGNPFARGFPVLVVLDANGNALHVQDNASLVDAPRDSYDPDKVLSFLSRWAPVSGPG